MQTQSNSAAKNDSAQNDSAVSLEALQYNGEFIDRHIGPRQNSDRANAEGTELRIAR